MWIYGIIDRAGLLFPWINQKEFSSRKRPSGAKKLELSEMNFHSLENKNVVTSGEFFPARAEAFIERLVQEKANVISQLTAETDILICGKYPDWMLIQEARLRAINVIFIDKASDLFTGSTPVEQSNFESESMYISQVPLGI